MEIMSKQHAGPRAIELQKLAAHGAKNGYPVSAGPGLASVSMSGAMTTSANSFATSSSPHRTSPRPPIPTLLPESEATESNSTSTL